MPQSQLAYRAWDMVPQRVLLAISQLYEKERFVPVIHAIVKLGRVMDNGSD